MMPPKKKHESLTIKQAQHKNHALDEHLSLVQKVIEQERAHREEDVERERKRIQMELDKIRVIKPPTAAELMQVQKNRKTILDDVCLHIVFCYLKRQERNKAKWKDDMNYGHLTERPLTTPDHFSFISSSFPEVFKVSSGDPWGSMHNPDADIFEHGRAAHDMKCMSTRSKPVVVSAGAYPALDPMNIRVWRPPGSINTLIKENKNVNANTSQNIKCLKKTEGKTTPKVKSTGKKGRNWQNRNNNKNSDKNDLVLPGIVEFDEKAGCYIVYKDYGRKDVILSTRTKKRTNNKLRQLK